MLSNQSIYASLCSSIWSHLLCSKLCQHNPPTPRVHALVSHLLHVLDTVVYYSRRMFMHLYNHMFLSAIAKANRLGA